MSGGKHDERGKSVLKVWPSAVRLRRRPLLTQILIYGLAVSLAGFFVIPFLWMVFGSFKSDWDILQIPPTLLPTEWTFANYPSLFDRLPVLRLYMNSLFVTSTVVFLQVSTSALVGYVLGKIRFPGRDLLFGLILSMMMVPFFVIMVPLYVLIAQLGWVDSYLALIVPATLNSFGIFLVRQFAHNIPDELLDAARIDGASELRILLQIGLPLLSPALASLAIFAFIGQWGSFLWPLMVINSTEMRTIPLGLALLASTFQGSAGSLQAGASTLGVLLAGNVVAVVPVLLLFVALQRRITEGIALTGMGGH